MEVSNNNSLTVKKTPEKISKTRDRYIRSAEDELLEFHREIVRLENKYQDDEDEKDFNKADRALERAENFYKSNGYRCPILDRRARRLEEEAYKNESDRESARIVSEERYGFFY